LENGIFEILKQVNGELKRSKEHQKERKKNKSIIFVLYTSLSILIKRYWFNPKIKNLCMKISNSSMSMV
jgi:hypothetical protein